MQAKDLIVLGSSRLLGKLYCNDIDIGGSASISTISSDLSLTNTTDSSSTTTGALKVSGGVGIAKKLYVGGNTYHSGATYFGSTYNISSSGQATLSQVKVGTGSGDTTITNNSATIANITSTEIKATNVNVTNKLYALKYDLESVADLGGSFIVAPTLIVPNSTQATDSNASLTVAKSGTTLTLTIKDPSISTNQIAGFTWTQNYKVKVSGKISNTAIGTCTGKITSTNLSSTQMTLSVTCDSNIASQITAGSYQIANYNLNIMLYNADTSASGETLPIGIWLQSYGLTKNPTIEIWNGQMTTPKVRLGYLNGIVYDKKDTTTNPNGLNQTLGSIWGLYSSDVYLEGSIVAKGGRIGGWTIGDGYITSNSNRTTYNATTAGITIDKDGIGAGNGSLNTFYLKHSDGSMMVKKGSIANFTIDGSKLYSNSHSAYNTAKTGIYIGDDYISFGSGGITYFDVNGTGKVGPWTLSTTYFRNGNIASATNTSVSGVYLGTDGLNISNGTVATTSYITKSAVNIGNKLTWNGSVLKVDGEITASKLTISSGATISGDGASQILNSEIEIGGRNLYISSTAVDGYLHSNGTSISTMTSAKEQTSDFISVDGISTLTLQCWTPDLTSSDQTWLAYAFYSDKNMSNVIGSRTAKYSDAGVKYLSYVNIPVVSGAKYIRVSYRKKENGYIKVETGNKATDWTPAPEDVAVDIADAKKTATNCITEISNAGIWVTPSGKKPDANGDAIVGSTTGTLINADGVGIYKSGTKVAQYGEDVTIGITDGSQSYAKFDYHSMQLFAKDETEPYFYISDLRDEDGIAELTEQFSGDGIQTLFQVNCSVYEEVSAGVYDSDNNLCSGYTISRNDQDYTINPSPSTGESIIIKYKTKDSDAKAFTIGYRQEGTVGALSTVIGMANIASGQFSCATGRTTIASGVCSHSEGMDTKAIGADSHAEGCETKAIADDCHAEGWQTTAEGSNSHAEGGKTEATYFCSHAEGYMTYSWGRATHTEGSNTQAIGQMAHAEGYNTMANGMYSHSQNQSTIANKKAQTVIGSCNIIDQSSTTMHTSGDTSYGSYAFIIGNGYTDSNSSIHRSNALTVDWDGTITANGYICNNIGGNSSTTHASTLKTWFNNNKSSISRNTVLSYWSSAYGNGSQYFGYFLNGYDTSPYGGFFVCHYTTPWYVGISNGNYTQYELTRTATSSRKTKENIKLMKDDEAKKLYNLDVISFDYKKGYEEGKKNQFGLIAEDCDKIIPYVVCKPDDNEDSIWGIDYTKFVPYLIKNLQLHEEKIKELEKEIEILKSQNK